MLDQIEIRGLKSIREAALPLRSLNVMIGANGSGKSNFIGAFGLLRELVEGRLQSAVAKAGGASSLLHHGPKRTETIELKLVYGRIGYDVKLAQAEGDALFIEREDCWHNGEGFSSPDVVDLASAAPSGSTTTRSVSCAAGLPAAMVAHVEAALGRAVGAPKLIPHLVLHEYEAWIFSDPARCAWVFDDPSVGPQLVAIATTAGGPERVNDGATTAPSKRIAAVFPPYRNTPRPARGRRAELLSKEIQLRSETGGLNLTKGAVLSGTTIRLGTDQPIADEPSPHDPTSMHAVKLRLFDSGNRPYASKRFALLVGAKTVEGTTDGRGALSAWVAKSDTTGRLVLWIGTYPEGPTREWGLELSTLGPPTEPRELQKRLENLGFASGRATTKPTKRLREALKAFQLANGLPPTGDLDEDTSALLQVIH